MNKSNKLALIIALAVVSLLGIWTLVKVFNAPVYDKDFEEELHSPKAISDEKQTREILVNRIKVNEYVSTVNKLHTELVTLDTSSSSKYVEFHILDKLRFQNKLLSSLALSDVLVPLYKEQIKVIMDESNQMKFRLDREGKYFAGIPSILIPMLQIENYEKGRS